MNQHPSESEQAANSLAQYLAQFEEAWKRGDGPDIEQFVAFCEGQWEGRDQSRRIKLLEELIMLDLGFRWQQLPEASDLTESVSEQRTVMDGADGSKRWLLDDYVAQYPELGPTGTLPLPLVLREYRVRQEHGDTPSHQEYVDRFPEHSRTLRTDLALVDTELSAAIDSHTSARAAFSTSANNRFVGTRFGDYELLDEIARGGMGVVYRARQLSLNRIVALKMILSGQFASEEDVFRFRSEAEAAANLQHPNIVGIYEVGTIDGQHYFSMAFIEGHSLADQAVLGTMEVEEAAGLVSQVATAMEYAHQQGILHRDLKPHNILMDAKNQPWVTDFGLAKRIEGQSDLTGTGQILGTPSYMPPEQASADATAMGPASDVYSLGAILYELVTGRPPFKAQTPLDTLLQVLGEEPVSPHSLNGSVPADLETIILKCLNKDPRRRYQSAQELVEELGRYLAGEPIQARPIGQWKRAWRWCRRRPALAGLYGTAAVFLLMLGIGGPMVAFQQASLRSKADRATEAALQNLKTAEMERQRGNREAALAKANAKEARRNLKIAERNAYCSDMILVQINWETANLGVIKDLLARYRDRDDLKGFEWHYWNRVAHRELLTVNIHDAQITTVVFSPDGKRIASGDISGTMKIWNSETGQIIRTSTRHSRNVHSIAFSPDGKRIVSSNYDKTVISDSETDQLLLTLKETGVSLERSALSPDGKWIAQGYRDKTVEFWDTTTGKKKLTLMSKELKPARSFPRLCFNPTSNQIVYSLGSMLKVCDLETGEESRTLNTQQTIIYSVAWSPDGKWIANSGAHYDKTKLSIIEVWNAKTGEITHVLNGHSGPVASVTFSPNSSHIVSGSWDRTVKVWDTKTGNLTNTLKGHSDPVVSVAVSPDGKRFVSASRDGTVKIWDSDTSQQARVIANVRSVGGMDWSPDGKQIVAGCNNNTVWPNSTVKVWNSETGQLIHTLNGHPNSSVLAVAFSPDGTKIISASGDKTMKIWNYGTDQLLLTLKGHKGVIREVVFSPNGKQIVSRDLDNTVKIWDSETGQLTLTINNVTHPVSTEGFSPDGKRILFGLDNLVKIWDGETGELAHALKGDSGTVTNLAFSPDGKRIASGNTSGTMKVWNSETGQLLLTLKGDSGPVTNLAFSPDGKQLLGTSRQKLTVWDTETGQRKLTRSEKGLWNARFSPNGKRIFASSRELGGFHPATKIWDAETGQFLLTLKGTGIIIWSPNGTQFASVTRLGDHTQGLQLKIWDARPLKSP